MLLIGLLTTSSGEAALNAVQDIGDMILDTVRRGYWERSCKILQSHPLIVDRVSVDDKLPIGSLLWIPGCAATARVAAHVFTLVVGPSIHCVGLEGYEYNTKVPRITPTAARFSMLGRMSVGGDIVSSGSQYSQYTVIAPLSRLGS